MTLLMDRAQALFGELKPQDLANLLYAQSRLRHLDRQFLGVSAALCKPIWAPPSLRKGGWEGAPPAR